MIPDLEHKANNEKYFKSIRYFSHSLKGEKRRNFIAQVAEHNIYLAAQCIMSAEKDEELENRLIEKAQSIAQNFTDSENSAKGFLALAEFESLKTIITLFSNIKKPNSTHLQVIAKIFENKQPSIFCYFLSIFTQASYKKILINYAISSYNGELPVTANKIYLNQVIRYLLRKNSTQFGVLEIFVEKFNLYNHLEYILDRKIEDIIVELANRSKGLSLSFKIAETNNLLSIFTPEYFIEKVSNNIGKKGVNFALNILNRFNIKNNEQFNDVLRELVDSTEISKKNILISINQKYLLSYLSDDLELMNKVSAFFYKQFKNNSKNLFRKNKTNVRKYKTYPHFHLLEKLRNKKISIDDAFLLYFNKYKEITVEMVLNEILSNFETDLMELSHKLRVFELQGNVKYVRDKCCYIQPHSFRTEKLLFLHKNQITDKQKVNRPNEVLKEGDIITFRIIGINQQNHRLNISCLDSFKPENSAVPTDE